MNKGRSKEEHLEKSLVFIRSQEALMLKALQSQGRLLVAIKHASTMLGELRTSILGPKQYYELYIACFDALSRLASYMREDHKNHHLADVYEIVQYTGNILPRLYLMVTVASAFLATNDCPTQEVLRDLLQMTRGIQNPIRGLFLRYYLGQVTRGYLYTSTVSELESSIKFTITNFVEMNKLWVRLQHHGHSSERNQRTEERKELQTIVGSNLLRLAQLDKIDSTLFSNRIISQITEQIVQCHDVLAQEYLMDVLCEAFPAEYHAKTLNKYLDTVKQLSPQASLPVIFHASIGRLIQYAGEQDSPQCLSPLTSKSPPSRSIESLSIKSSISGISGISNEARPVNNGSEANGQQSPEESVETDNMVTEEETAVKASESSTEIKSDEEDESKDADGDNGKGADEEENGQKELEEAQEESHEQALEELGEEDTKDAHKTPDVESTKVVEDEGSEEVHKRAPEEVNGSLESLDEQDHGDTVGTADSERSRVLVQAIEQYWRTLSELSTVRQVTVADKAVIVQDILKLAHIIGQSDVDGCLNYIAQSQNIPACVEVQNLLLSLFDNVPLLDVLAMLQKYPTLLEKQTAETKEVIASRVLSECLQRGTHIDNYDVAQQVFDLFSLILKSGDVDTTKLAELIHLLGSETDMTESLKLFQLAHKSLRAGGVAVIQQTYGVLCSVVIKLLKKNPTSAPTPTTDSQIFRFINKTISDLVSVGDKAGLAFHYYILAAAAADERGAEEASYEFFVKAFTLYEEAISDSKAQYAALASAIGLLQRTVSFSRDNYDTLATRCTLYGTKLLRKSDQCQAVLLSSHLWLPEMEENENPQKVIETLQRALRIADATMDSDTSIQLFCDVLNRYLYFLLLQVPTVTARDVSELIKVIRSNLESSESESGKKRFEEIARYITEEPNLADVVVS